MRIVYSSISLLLIYLSYKYFPFFTNNAINLNIFSYIGSVATMVGLFIAICEIIHTAHETKSIQEQSVKLLKDVKSIENASSLSDCISSIDAVNKNVFNENFDAAITNFQNFRKICVKVIPKFNEQYESSDKLNELGDIELIILKSTKTNSEAPLGKKQKNELLKRLLVVKQKIEFNNPAGRS